MPGVINKFSVSTSDLPSSGGRRTISVAGGDDGSKAVLQVVSSHATNQDLFYNFNTRTFQKRHTPECNRHISFFRSVTSYSTTVSFPSATGKTYVVQLIGIDNTSITKQGLFVKQKVISQAANATVTFSPATTNSNYYETFPTIQSTASAGSTASALITLNWDIDNKAADAYGYGLILAANDTATTTITSSGHGSRHRADITDGAWYFETTETVNGTTSSSTTVVVDDLTDLAVGMQLYYKTGTTQPSSYTEITSIDEGSKTLTLSVAQSLSDGNTMTFRAYGWKNIYSAIGLSVKAKNTITTAEHSVLTKTVRGSVSSSTTVTLNGTRGISGNNLLTYSGANVDNSSTNTVTTNRTDGSTATASASAGEIIVTNAQTFVGGETLTFYGSTEKIVLSSNFAILQYPNTDINIYLDLDKFITVGVQTS